MHIFAIFAICISIITGLLIIIQLDYKDFNLTNSKFLALHTYMAHKKEMSVKVVGFPATHPVICV